MERFFQRTTERFRGYRSQKFPATALFFFNLGISANLMTLISLLFGLSAVYFLFSNHYLFLVLGLFHLLADGLDGLIARVSKLTIFGKYFDYLSDQTITLLLLLKIGFYLQDYYVFIITGIFVLAQTIYVASKFTVPILFTRTLMVALLIFNFPFLVVLGLPTLAYLATGVASLYSLMKQGEHYWGRKR